MIHLSQCHSVPFSRTSDGGMGPARFDEIVLVEEKWTQHLHMYF